MPNTSDNNKAHIALAAMDGETTSNNETPPTYSGGSGDPPMGPTSKDYIDAKVEATRAQNDARFQEVLSRLDRMPSLWAMIGTVGTAAIGLLAIFAFAGDRFDGGVQVSSAVSQMSAENRAIARSNAESISALAVQVESKDQQIDALITALEVQAQRNAKENP